MIDEGAGTAESGNSEEQGDERGHGALAACLTATSAARARFEQRAAAVPYERWGTDMEAESIQQMENACQLPVAVAGALMPDAHVGYGLPIAHWNHVARFNGRDGCSLRQGA